MKKIKEKLNKSDIRKLVLSANVIVRNQFKKKYKDEIDKFIDLIYKAYLDFNIYDKAIQKNTKDKRKAYVAMFLYNALTNLIDSFNLYISGYYTPSGNLMRSFNESVAMAILISYNNLDYYERFRHKPEKFQIQNSVDLLIKENKKRKIKLDYLNLNEFNKMQIFYHKPSHTSIFSISTKMAFYENKDFTTFGTYFDSMKMKGYVYEINNRASATKFLTQIIKKLYTV